MMSRWLLPFALFVAAFAPSVLHAQPSDILRQTRPTLPAVIDHDKMYEDIEIFRRILDRKLTPLYPIYGKRMTNVWDNPLQREPVGSLEGVYLNGQGIVYTATLSSLQIPEYAQAELSDPVNGGWTRVVLRDSEWDKARRQVRNEKEKEEPKKPEASKPPELSDVLLKMLKDNGHHFSQLGQEESLTLVLTVRETNPSNTAQKGKQKAEGATKANSQGPTGSADDLQTKKTRDVELLAELHLKQGRYKESLKLWGDIETMRRETLAKQGLTVADDPDQNRWATLYRMMAQCYLGLEQTEQARHALDQGDAFLKRAKEAAENKDKTASADKPKTELPVKLIVSAPKKLLDTAKDGKLSFEGFRNRAKVKTIGKSNAPK